MQPRLANGQSPPCMAACPCVAVSHIAPSPPPPCMQLVMSGRTVVAAVKSTDRVKEVFGAMSLQEGVQQVSLACAL